MKCNCNASAILLDEWGLLAEPEDWIQFKRLVNKDNEYEMDAENIPKRFPCLVRVRKWVDGEGNTGLDFYIVERAEAIRLFPGQCLLHQGQVYDLRDVDINFNGEGVTMNEGQPH